jgi:hypothetical protein
MAALLWFIAFLVFLGLEMLMPGGCYFACLALGALVAVAERFRKGPDEAAPPAPPKPPKNTFHP